MTYSRLQNPTVAMLEERIALMEGAESCRAQASGMAAMTAALLCQLKTGDHVVAARAAFGSCRWLCDQLLPKFGIDVTIIDSADNAAWEAAIRPNDPRVLLRNPRQPDARYRRSRPCLRPGPRARHHQRGRQRLRFAGAAAADGIRRGCGGLFRDQADGRAGPACSPARSAHRKQWIDEVLMPPPFQRNTGPTLSAFKRVGGAEGAGNTPPAAPMRRARAPWHWASSSNRALTAAGGHLLHPGLPSHPRHALAMQQMDATGPIFALDVGTRTRAFAILDALELVDISNNIGDARSLMCHPASTTHANMGDEARAAMGVTEGLLRIKCRAGGYCRSGRGHGSGAGCGGNLREQPNDQTH